MNNIRTITEDDDAKIVKIIRANLEAYHLDIPGTAYFDPELEHLSRYYAENPEKREYLIATDESGEVIGGVGIAEFNNFENCAEIQKLYLSDKAKGKGMGKQLMHAAEETARQKGYSKLYLETHSVLKVAIGLYEKIGFYEIEKPKAVLHTTMDRFYMKDISW